MKNTSCIALLALAVILAACASARAQGISAAATATPATYTFSCNANLPLNVTLDSFNFNLQSVLNIGSQSSGAGAGKVTFNPLTVKFRTDSADARRLQQMVQTGQHFSDCTLTETLGDAGRGAAIPGGFSKGAPNSGSTLQWVFRLVAPSGLTVIGSDASNTDSGGYNVPTGFIEANFEYGAVTME